MSVAEARNGAAGFDPRLLVFACNWCSYAGADTAGVSRLTQTPHFRLLRVMCSGRIHPAHVLRAFARGADGVMVSGCHFGDCHYLFGNHRAVEQFEKTRALARLLGLEEERLRLEWISAAEGIRFAETMNDFVAQVRGVGPSPIAPDATPAGETASDAAALGASGALRCLECGRCTAVCPLTRHQRFSPRRLLSRAAAAGLDAVVCDPTLWACLTCAQCQPVCPSQVDYPRFILTARARAIELGAGPFAPAVAAAGAGTTAPATVVPCSHGGVFEQIALISARPGLRQSRLEWRTPDLAIDVVPEGGQATADELLFVGCSPYFAAYFGGAVGDALHESLRAAVRLLNRADIVPALLANERCCGSPLRLTGRAGEATRLESLVAEQIRASGARRVIAACPECLVALRRIAAGHGGGFEAVHLSQRLSGSPSSRAASGAVPGAPTRVTFQDPCRLGRYSGLYDPPRELLRAAGGLELIEMEHTREAAICCGNTAWVHCDAATQSFQRARLAEAAATGGTLVTACPGCFIHLRCAQQALAGTAEGAVPIADLWTLLAGAGPASPDGHETQLVVGQAVTG